MSSTPFISRRVSARFSGRTGTTTCLPYSQDAAEAAEGVAFVDVVWDDAKAEGATSTLTDDLIFRGAAYQPSGEELDAAETANGFGWVVEWDGGWLERDRMTDAQVAAARVGLWNGEAPRVVPNVPVPA